MKENNFIGPLSPELMAKTVVVGHLTWGNDGSFQWCWYNIAALEQKKASAFDMLTKEFLPCAAELLTGIPEDKFKRFDFGDWTFLAWNANSAVKVRMFERKWLDNQIRKAENGVRIEDKTGKLLFVVKDGSHIRMKSRDGSVSDWHVRYIDDSHFELNEKGCDGGPFSIYHRMQFGDNIPDAYTVELLS